MTAPEKKPLTARERRMLLIGMGVGAAVVGVAVLAWSYGRADGDESGIRVKNGGSVDITTDSAQGFTWARWWHWKSKGKSKGAFSLVVTSADCGEGPSRLSQVTKVTVGVPAGTVELEDRGNNIHVDVSWLWWWAVGGKITHGDSLFLIKTVEANGMDGNGNNAILKCSFVGDSKLHEVFLDLP